MQEAIAFFENHGIDFVRGKELSRVSAMRLGGRCAIFVSPASEEEFIKTVVFAKEHGYKHKTVGRMSNILPPDEYYDGIIISTLKMASYSVAENTLTAQCGAVFSRLAASLARLGYGGTVELSGIPGTVGGMIFSNAGAYGLEISDVLIDARCYSLCDGEIVTLCKDDMCFSYRHSVLSEGNFLLLSARIALCREDSFSVKAKIERLYDERRKKQPLDMPSLGSAFLRPNGYFAAKLIDDAGLRGFSIGGAEVSAKHAGFIVNKGGATASDVKRLISYVKQCVFEKFCVNLVPEIEFLE